MNTPPDPREEEDCPGSEVCHGNCDQHTRRLTPERLAELGALAEAATPGPWFHVLEQDGDEDGPNGQGLPTRTWLMPIADDAPVAFSQETAADAAFIAAWNPETAKAVLHLLAEKEAALSAEFSRGMDVDTDLVDALVQRDAALAEIERLRAELDERETVARSRHNRVIHQRDEWARRATEAEAVAGGEVGKFRGEIARLREAQRDANALARQLADAVGERDTAIEEAEQASSAKHQTENDLSSQIVTLELNLEDVAAERDTALAALDFQTALLEDARSALESAKDRMDDHAYDELSSPLSDGATDEFGVTYVSERDAALAEVKRLRLFNGQVNRDLFGAAFERDAALARLAKVEALHHRREFDWTKDGVTHGQTEWPDMCAHDRCHSRWPCPTGDALAEGGGE